MNKYARVAIIAGILVIVAAALGFVLTRPSESTLSDNASESSATKAPDVPPTTAPTPTATEAKGVYTAYVPANFESTAAKKRVLFFHAPWCPQCRALDADLTSKPLPDGVAIFKTDYDSNQALRQKYGVTQQTTFVEVDKDGNKIKSYVAYDTPNLEAVTKALEL